MFCNKLLTLFIINWSRLLSWESVYRVLHCKVTLSPFPYSALWKKFTKYKWVRNYALGLVVTYIIWNYSAWEICLFFPIYLTIHFSQSEYVDIYFVLWVINQWLYYYFCSVFAHVYSFVHWESSLLAPVSPCRNSVIVSSLGWISGLFVSALPYILELEDAPRSLCASGTGSAVSHFSKGH